MSRTLSVFGNEYLADDSLAREVAQHLTGVNINHCRSPDDLLTVLDDELLILDVVKNTDKVVVITDPQKIRARNIITMHDFDVGYFLHLLAELGEDKPVKIIGIPSHGDAQQIAQEVQACI